MVTTTVGIALIVAQSVLGGHGLVATGGSCSTCGVASAVEAAIMQLQTSPSWCERKAAARALRRFGWECHPEVATALVSAMLADPNRWVRNESAESLAKLAPCVPGVHEALAHAATKSPNLFTRLWARKGLRALGRRCVGTCSICGPIVTSPLPAGSFVVETPPVIGPPTFGDPSIGNAAPPVMSEPASPPPPPGPPDEPSLDPRIEPPSSDSSVSRMKPVSPDLQPLPPPAEEIPPSASPGPAPGDASLRFNPGGTRPVTAPRPRFTRIIPSFFPR